ncbi:MAG TPA: bifunctional demethylmenaquinone methyltransferase/2-methoxy-6-polyprenyl-1,4-benzoquinol methylase UbiE [Bacillota bacterium]|nr:bifunctional demethylmenaquinone methyltransferase/2-methoxy-6-polyprenyl-1,4-benzoquinol methylase UbiE [Bacillota bacterium]
MFRMNSISSMKEQQIYEFFNSIAPRYDITNSLMSWGIHHHWRKQLIHSLSLPKNCKIMDLCCGTGAVTLDLARLAGPGSLVVGVDFSEVMLSIARQRLSGHPFQKQIQWIVANALELPFSDQSFDCITIAYGLRNVTDILRALREMRRVLKVGGQIAILEMAVPVHPVVKRLHERYLSGWVPFLGHLITNYRKPYQYLHESIRAFPQPEQICKLLEDIGFANIQCQRLTWGIVALYTGQRKTP